MRLETKVMIGSALVFIAVAAFQVSVSAKQVLNNLVCAVQTTAGGECDD